MSSDCSMKRNEKCLLQKLAQQEIVYCEKHMEMSEMASMNWFKELQLTTFKNH